MPVVRWAMPKIWLMAMIRRSAAVTTNGRTVARSPMGGRGGENLSVYSRWSADGGTRIALAVVGWSGGVRPGVVSRSLLVKASTLRGRAATTMICAEGANAK